MKKCIYKSQNILMMIRLNKFIYFLMFLFISTFIVNAQDHIGDFTVTGNVNSEGGSYYFGDGTKSFSSFSLSAVNYTSNHSSNSSIRLLTDQQELFGALSGQNNAFGLKDKNGDWILVNSITGGKTVIKSNNSIAMTLFDTGKVMLGDVDISSDRYKLFVEDGILAESLRVAVNGELDWADYVFDDKYELMPLSNVKDFIHENKRLPNVPSAGEMVENGLDVLESDAILLRKIEEAYLYIIEQEEQIVNQQNQIDDLIREVANIKNRDNEN